MMPNEWISALELMESMTNRLEPREVARAILVWAREGLIAARAKRLVVGGETTSEIAIPREFWRYLVEDDEGQDWTLGQFASQIGHVNGADGTTFWRAYGVEFRRGDVMDITPAGLLVSRSHGGDSDRKEPRVGGRWHQWVAELTYYLHHEGIPDGVGSQGQEQVIQAIASALSERGIKSLERSTVQPVVQAVLDRFRGAEN